MPAVEITEDSLGMQNGNQTALCSPIPGHQESRDL